MPSLRQRPRARRLIERAVARALREVGSSYRLALPAPPPPPPPPPPEPPTPLPEDFLRALPPRQPPTDHAPVTHALFARLLPEDVAEVERRLAVEAPEQHAHYASVPAPAPREALSLIYGVWLGVSGVIERTGLSGEQPPEDVHAMARGPLAAAGGLYEADLVVDALAPRRRRDRARCAARSTSAAPPGASCGARAPPTPTSRWHGCDPNAPAIAWAGEHLPHVELVLQRRRAAAAARRWLARPRLRDLDLVALRARSWGCAGSRRCAACCAPGGHLVLTTHGLDRRRPLRASTGCAPPEQSSGDRSPRSTAQGWWYAPEFGEDGDWGVVNPDWGTAFLTPEWLLAQLCPRWRVLEFAPGRNQDNQDVYVLERV